MGGGLLQLVAYGAQDAYLSGNPQITFWKGLYKRHTNFAMEAFRVNFTGQPNWGTKQSAILGRHADLLYSTYVEVILPHNSTTQWNNDQGRLGFNLIKYAELEIGGQLIDRLYGEWLFLWAYLTEDLNTRSKQNVMQQYEPGVTNIPTSLNNPDQCGIGGRPAPPNVLYIPLYFFFTKNPGAALPLIALQYHEVKINLLWNKQELIKGDFDDPDLPGPTQAAVYVDYIYLDVEERRRMAQQSHEYLIEQTQFNEDKGISTASNRIDLTFNHPVKELVWVVQPASYTNCSIAKEWGANRLRPFTYNQEAIYDARLQINGQDRMDTRFGSYFHVVQQYQHHTAGCFNETPLTHQPGIYMYSFALRPEEHQPSGTCNFSRIDTATLVMNMSGAVVVSDAYSEEQLVNVDASWNVRVYAVNYNILRIMSGMAGLAYSN